MATQFCRNHLRRSILVFTIAISSLLALNILRACPFCLSPPMTLVQEIDSSDIVAIVELLHFEVVRTGKTPIPESTVRIRKFVQGSDLASKCGRLQSGQAIVVRGEVAGAPGDLFLLFGSLPRANSSPQMTFAPGTDESQSIPVDYENGSIEIVTADFQKTEQSSAKTASTRLLIPELISWVSSTPVSQEAIRYIHEAPPLSLPQSQRLLYYIAYLENADPLLSIDAWAEFANATYDDVKSVRNELPREKLRQWIVDPLMSPERLGLYGMMLGLCGDADDAAFLQAQIGATPPTGSDDKQFFRYGTDGLMGGYLILTGEEGVAFLEQTRLQPGVPTDSALAAVQAIEFIYSYETALVPQERLRTSMRKLLSNDAMRILTIMNLARWKDWDSWPELERIFFEESNDDRATQKAIVQFAEECRKATNTDGSPSQPATRADKFLTQAELEYPALFHATVNAEFIGP